MTAGDSFRQLQVLGGTAATSAGVILGHQEPRLNLLRRVVVEEVGVDSVVALEVPQVTKSSFSPVPLIIIIIV